MDDVKGREDTRSLVGRQPGATCTEGSLAVSCPVRHVVSLRARDSLRGIHPGETKAHVHTDLSTNALSSFIHNSPKLERTRMSCRVRGTHPGAHLGEGSALSRQKERTVVCAPTWMDRKHKQQTRPQMCDFSSMWFQKNHLIHGPEGSSWLPGARIRGATVDSHSRLFAVDKRSRITTVVLVT